MKVIMENWRKSVLSEEDKITTVGDLLKSLELARKAKKGKVQKDALKNTGAGLLLKMIPGASYLKSVATLAKALYKLPDDRRTNTGLDYLQVDDEISAVVDDRVETQFLNYAINRLVSMDPEFELRNIDMTQMLSDYIKVHHGGTKVEKSGGRAGAEI